MNQDELLAALGPLAPFYKDPAVGSIMVDSPNRVCVERQGKLEDTHVTFDSPGPVNAMIKTILGAHGVTLGPGKTEGHAMLADGTYVQAVVPPTAPDGPSFVLRKFPRPSFSWENLYEWGVLTRESFELLQEAMVHRKTLLVAGGSATGKTTIATMLAESIPPDERVAVLNPVPTVDLRHPHSFRLAAEDSASMPALLDVAGRMRAAWFLIGELRGPETLSLLHSLTIGKSAILSLQATSVEDALARLERMCLMANAGLDVTRIRGVIASALGVILLMERVADSRKATRIVEVCGLRDTEYDLRTLFQYDSTNGALRGTGTQPSWKVG